MNHDKYGHGQLEKPFASAKENERPSEQKTEEKAKEQDRSESGKLPEAIRKTYPDQSLTPPGMPKRIRRADLENWIQGMDTAPQKSLSQEPLRSNFEAQAQQEPQQPTPQHSPKNERSH